MKTAISIPDKLFVDADRLARKLGKNRSQLFREAVTEYIARRSPDKVTVALDGVLDALGTGADRFVAEVSRRTLERVEW